MNTIVMKGDHFSFNQTRKLEVSEKKDIKVVLVYPTGHTNTFLTSSELLDKLTESEDAIIYGNIFVMKD